MATRRDVLKTMVAVAAAPVIGLPDAVTTMTPGFMPGSSPPWTMVKMQWRDLLTALHEHAGAKATELTA